MGSTPSLGRLARVLALAATVVAVAACAGSDTDQGSTSPTSPDTGVLRIDAAEAEARLRVRLQPRSFVESVEDLAVTEVADGLYATLVLQYPESSQPVTTQDLAALGYDVEEAVSVALDNTLLGGRPPSEVAEVHDGAEVQVFGGQVGAASWILLVDELVGDEGTSTTPLGVVIAIPTRDDLDLHLVRPDSRPVLDLMAQVAHDTHRAGPASITDNLFWWHDATLVAITTIDGHIRSLPPGLDAALD